MRRYRIILFLTALIAIGLVGFALYLQHVKGMMPCPLCIIQRYAFVGVGLICLVAAFLPTTAARAGALLGAVVALAGAGVAVRHLWILAHPGVSCGIDPLETSLNKIPTAEWMPYLFQADGLCSDRLDPVLGLQIPQWSLIWLVALAIALLWTAWRARA
jgi:disulfide bond formation protein DsbB